MPPLGRLVAAQVLLHACMTASRMAAPLLALRDGFSPAAVGVLLALFSLSPVFLALPIGRYADRHGLARTVRWAVLAGVLGAGGALAMPGFAALCACALLAGGANGAAAVAIQRHAGRMASGALQLRRVFSWLALASAISSFIGPFFAGLLIDHAGAVPGDTRGYRAAFAFAALLPIGAWWLVRRLTEPPSGPAPAGAAAPAATDLLRDPAFRRLVLVNAFLSASWDVHTFLVPLFGVARGLGAATVGTILGGFAVAAAVARATLPLVAGRLHEWAVLAACMLVVAVLFGVYPLTTSALGMGVCSLLLGIALGLEQPMVMSTLHQLTPAARHGEAIALRLMVNHAASVSVPLLFGAAGAVVGIAAMCWTMSALGAGSARLAWRLKASLREAAPHEQSPAPRRA